MEMMLQTQNLCKYFRKSVPEVFSSPYTGTLYQMPLLPFHLPDTLPEVHTSSNSDNCPKIYSKYSLFEAIISLYSF